MKNNENDGKWIVVIFVVVFGGCWLGSLDWDKPEPAPVVKEPDYVLVGPPQPAETFDELFTCRRKSKGGKR